MNYLRSGHPDRNFLLQALSQRRWLLVCSFLMILSALFFFGAAPRAFSASITVNADQIKGYINPLAFGQNVMFASNTMWDHRTDSLRSEPDGSLIEVKSKIEALAPTILRFPGGTAADMYLWEDGLGFRTTNPDGEPSADKILELDGAPQDWSVGKGLLVDSKTNQSEYTLHGQLGDAFNFTAFSGSQLTISDVYEFNVNGTHPAGAGVRPGSRAGKQPSYWDGWWLNTYGIIEHMKLVNSLGAEALLTVNYKTGLLGGEVSEEASLNQRQRRAQALVAFCNGRTNDTRSLGNLGGIDWHTVGYWARKRAALGFPNPFEVRYWEVGNEPYLSIDDTTPSIPATSAASYGEEFNYFARAMKEVDPKIRVGAAGMTRGQRYPDIWRDWNTTVLAATRNDLDFFSIHPYYPNASLSQAGGNYQNNKWFTAVMAGATQALADLQAIRRDQIDVEASSRRKNIGLAVTEYGFWLQTGLPPAEEWSNLARALYDADLLLGLIKENMVPSDAAHPLRLTAATAWNLHGQIPNAAIGFNWLTFNRTIRPQYHVFKMLRENLASKRLVQTDIINNPTFDVDPVGNVTITSAKRLEALAAFPNSNKGSLTLVVINRSLTGDITATIQITGEGFSPKHEATVTVLGYKNTQDPPHFNAIGDHNEDDAPPINTVEPVSDSSTNITDASMSFDYTFKAHSLTIIEFIKATP